MEERRLDFSLVVFFVLLMILLAYGWGGLARAEGEPRDPAVAATATPASDVTESVQIQPNQKIIPSKNDGHIETLKSKLKSNEVPEQDNPGALPELPPETPQPVETPVATPTSTAETTTTATAPPTTIHYDDAIPEPTVNEGPDLPLPPNAAQTRASPTATPKPKRKLLRTRGGECMAMVPTGVFDLRSCAAVTVNIELEDCKTGEPTFRIENAPARFQCKKKPMQLTYWYRQDLYIGKLKRINKSTDKARMYDVYAVDLIRHGKIDHKTGKVGGKIESEDLKEPSENSKDEVPDDLLDPTKPKHLQKDDD